MDFLTESLPLPELSTEATVLIVAVVSFVAGLKLSQWFDHTFLGVGADKSEPDKPFMNGVSFIFLLKVFIQGPSLDTIVRILSANPRRRLYVAHKHWIFFGYETWWIGHPAIAAHAFGISQQKMWRKLTKDETLKHFYLAGETEKEKRKAMLYTGDDDGWRHARAALTPFFYTYDFGTLDERMDAVVQKHLQRIAMKHHGEEELLEMLLLITVDLLCQCLWRCALPWEELVMLTDAMTEYVVPGTSKKAIFPGGLTALDYHKKVANEMADSAPEDTLAYLIKNKSPLTEELKSDNLAFLLEALTPAFASFWTICNVCMMTQKDMREKAKEDPVFRQQCIKESLRMYPPVPILWPRMATCDQEMPNPLYQAPTLSNRSLFSKLFGPKPVEEQPTIKIKKGTTVVLFPGVYHYDDRFWVRPKDFIPERWDKQPDVLQGDSARFEARKRHTAFPGLVASKQDTLGLASGRVSMLASKARSANSVSQSLRAKIFGADSELFSAEASKDQLLEATAENNDDLQAWSFLPFGLGPHTCMGRRLGIRMVDAIVYNFLEYDVMFYNGVIPSLFTRKQWHERTVATAAAYNFPADPVLIQLKRPKATNVRKSVFCGAIET